jgi:methylphosphotriester-DNA--protein-cysteine methyltransferase
MSLAAPQTGCQTEKEASFGCPRAEPLEPGPAAVANQLINTRLRAIEQERKPRETEDLEARIEALERSQEGGRRWGA